MDFACSLGIHYGLSRYIMKNNVPAQIHNVLGQHMIEARHYEFEDEKLSTIK